MRLTVGASCRVGRRVGRAIARDVLADGLPREWTGIDPQDADQLVAAGVVPDSGAWDAAVEAAREAYDAALQAAERGESHSDRVVRGLEKVLRFSRLEHPDDVVAVEDAADELVRLRGGRGNDR